MCVRIKTEMHSFPTKEKAHYQKDYMDVERVPSHQLLY